MSHLTQILGEAANQWIQKCTELSTEDLDYIFKLCRSFYIEAFLQLQQRYSFKDSFFAIADLLHPKNARSCEPSNLTSLFQRFPVLGKNINTSKAELDWRSHIHLEPEFFGCANDGSVRLLDAESYWSTVLKCKTPNGSTKCPNLAVCIAFLFSMPYSNVAAERVFSMLKLIKTDGRNSLHNITLSSLMRIKDWLKVTGRSACDAEFREQLIKSVLSVVANQAIEPGIRSGVDGACQTPDVLPF
ncbi:hypothetical protein OUZ56_015981 [Daphnia magna]|uniref:HAT C-terminal dimerisation domain-containing protein n=1 Tax=Daphnia magna TaxID=35525 RepID=A0ABR0APH5_9CRUS|nr:hypothetical protein OUZ56_015981 [Daphnia magna]